MTGARAVVVVDYGRGNLFSVCQAVAKVGGAPALSADPAVVRQAERLILPGVGAFADAMAGLRARGLDEAVKAFAATGRPLSPAAQTELKSVESGVAIVAQAFGLPGRP